MRLVYSNVYTKAIEQLEKGKTWLAHTMKMLNMKPWNYVGFAAFPNIDDKNTLKATGIVKREDDFKVKRALKKIENMSVDLFHAC